MLAWPAPSSHLPALPNRFLPRGSLLVQGLLLSLCPQIMGRTLWSEPGGLNVLSIVAIIIMGHLS